MLHILTTFEKRLLTNYIKEIYLTDLRNGFSPHLGEILSHILEITKVSVYSKIQKELLDTLEESLKENNEAR